MLAARLFLQSHFLSTALESLKEALEAVEEEHKLKKYPGLLRQYSSSVLSNDSLPYQTSTPPSLFSVPDVHPIAFQSFISYSADPINVLKNPCNPIKDPSARRMPSYVPGRTSNKATSMETTEWHNALAISKPPTTDLLNLKNLNVLAALSEKERVHCEDKISSWNLDVVNAQLKGMWLANEHSYDRHFGKGGS